MPLIGYLSAVYPPGEHWHLAMVTIAGVIILFLLAEFVVRLTIVYRQNNLSVLFAVVLAAGGFYTLGWTGLLAFVAGNVISARLWISEIESANRRAHSARVEETGKSPEPTSQSSTSTPITTMP